MPRMQVRKGQRSLLLGMLDGVQGRLSTSKGFLEGEQQLVV